MINNLQAQVFAGSDNHPLRTATRNYFNERLNFFNDHHCTVMSVLVNEKILEHFQEKLSEKSRSKHQSQKAESANVDANFTLRPSYVACRTSLTKN